MNIMLRFLICFWVFISLAIASNFDASEWDPYRLSDPAKTLTPLKVTTREDMELIGYSMGDRRRFDKHASDMREFFSNDKILVTWGGINAKTDTPKDFGAALERYAARAENNLLSWRLYYHSIEDRLMSVVGSYLPLASGCSYDGGAEIICNTHPDYWRHGVARAVVTSYIAADVMRSPFTYVWATAKPENEPSWAGVLSLGFKKWGVNLEDSQLPSHMKRPGRLFFRKDRSEMDEFLKMPVFWIEK